MDPSPCINGCTDCPNCYRYRIDNDPDLNDDSATTAADGGSESGSGTGSSASAAISKNPPSKKRPFYFPRDAKVAPYTAFRRREPPSVPATTSPDPRLISGIEIGFFPALIIPYDPAKFTFGNASLAAKLEDKKKCGSCKKRVGLLGFKCRCARVFCGKHRYPEEHGCTFDHVAFGKRILEKQNPVLETDKLVNRI
ncbi:Zinc finger A20 and AN1 domain-containing stress-associated protein 10 [Linum perenne]